MMFDIGVHYDNRPTIIFRGRDPETLAEAFDISIAKWELVVKRMRETNEAVLDGGHVTCGLCMLFFHWSEPLGENTCGACPVAIHTGMDSCEETPYEAFYPFRKTVEEKIVAAEAEVAFLKMLKAKYYGVQP